MPIPLDESEVAKYSRTAGSWIIGPLLLALLSLAVYWPATKHAFLVNWDDPQYVVENPLIRGLTLPRVASAFSSYLAGNYAPLHLVSYMLDYEIWGLQAFGFILGNLVLHTLNGLLYFLLLRRLEGNRAWIFLASLIFVLHPVQVESVVWVSQRKTLLAMTFSLAAIHSYASYRERGSARSAGLPYAMSLVSFLLALLSKSVAIVVPVVLLLYDLCLRGETKGRGFLGGKVPFLALGVAFGIVAVLSHSAQQLGGGTDYHGGSPHATFLTMLTVLIRYVALVLWPANLSAYYDPPVKTSVDFEVMAAGFVILLLILGGGILYRRRRDLFFWFAVFFVGLLPVSQIVPIVTLMNDRYLYFPMLGASAIVGYAFLRDLEWDELARSTRAAVRGALVLLVVGALAIATVRRTGVWRDSETLWADATRKAPHVAVTHDAYGEGLLAGGKVDEAIRQFQIALSKEPDFGGSGNGKGIRAAYANTHNNLGAAYGMKGRHDAATDQFEIAIRLNPRLAGAYFNLGNALMQKGDLPRAVLSLETAYRLNPQNPAFEANYRGARELFDARNRQQADSNAK